MFTTKKAFADKVKEIQDNPLYSEPEAFAFGFATIGTNGDMLDVWYPHVNLNPNTGEKWGSAGVAAIGRSVYGDSGHPGSITKPIVDRLLGYLNPFINDGKNHPNIPVLQDIQQMLEPSHLGGSSTGRTVPIGVAIPSLSNPVRSTADAYLRLHLLSHRLVEPNCMNLDEIFRHLPNNVWTNIGPIVPSEVDRTMMEMRRQGQLLTVYGQDKFPFMQNYIALPDDVRIANADRVRLGAYVGRGTTIMQEGFINFNAGTEGPAMVEGRISQGVFVGRGSDLGGSSSTMGTLSGGNETIISVGEDCLIGANGGIGISLGDRCTVEAGLYVTAGTPISFYRTRDKDEVPADVKGIDLSGQNDILFIRDGTSGKVIARPNGKVNKLNTKLHG